MNISKNEQLVVDGNSFYEIDLQCVQKKQSQKHIRRNEHQEQSRQPQSAADDPKNTAAGIISEKAGSIAASTVVVATASVIAASAVCSS